MRVTRSGIWMCAWCTNRRTSTRHTCRWRGSERESIHRSAQIHRRSAQIEGPLLLHRGLLSICADDTCLVLHVLKRTGGWRVDGEVRGFMAKFGPPFRAIAGVQGAGCTEWWQAGLCLRSLLSHVLLHKAWRLSGRRTHPSRSLLLLHLLGHLLCSSWQWLASKSEGICPGVSIIREKIGEHVGHGGICHDPYGRRRFGICGICGAGRTHLLSGGSDRCKMIITICLSKKLYLFISPSST